jgi:AAA+ ATPase superfamily predicted ATPase
LVKIGRWWNKNTEIDIVGWDAQKRYIFGECKWRNEIIGVKVLEQLKEKSFEVKGEIDERHYVLFSKSGFTQELVTLALTKKGLYLIDLEMIDNVMKG